MIPSDNITQLNPIIRIIPIIYDCLPDSTKYLTSCKEITHIINQNELFKHYGIKAVFEEGCTLYSPYLTKNVIPPKELRYNSTAGWLTVDDRIRPRLGWLKTSNPVDDKSETLYPNLDKGDIIIALIPLSIRTTPEIWSQENHFGPRFSPHVFPDNTISFIHHVSIVNEKDEIETEFFKEYDDSQIAHYIIVSVVEHALGIEDAQMDIIRIKFGYDTKDVPQDDELFKRLRVLFYGNDICSPITLKKAILLFDDVHFHDRPSFVYDNWGTIGAPSRIRSFTYSFASDGIPVLVHKAHGGSVSLFEDAVANEIEDKRFSKIFFEGFKADNNFRNLFIQSNANYAKGKGYQIAEAMITMDLGNKQYDLTKYRKCNVQPFDPNDPQSLEETFAHFLIETSMNLNLCCTVSHSNDLIPFTEYPTLEKLMELRYQRIVEKNAIPAQVSQAKLVYLSHKIFDYIIPENILQNAPIEDIVKYRKATRANYENFRKYLIMLNSQIESHIWDEQFGEDINRILCKEVIPVVDQYQNQCKKIWEDMFGTITKNIIKTVSGAGLMGFGISFFTGASFLDLLIKGCLIASPLMLPPIIDCAKEKRNLNRQNSLSYLMTFEGRTGTKQYTKSDEKQL